MQRRKILARQAAKRHTREMRRQGEPPPPRPSLLALRAAYVRKTWSEAERIARLRPDWRPLWFVPVVRVAEDALC